MNHEQAKGGYAHVRQSAWTIHQLEMQDYERACSLFTGLGFHLITAAVLQGTSPGRIYVDNAQAPKSAFLCSAEGYYLGGDPDNEAFNAALSNLIEEQILAGDTIRPGEDQIDLRFHPGTWEQKLEGLLGGKSILKVQRRHYVCNEPVLRWRDRIPMGLAVRRIDRALLQKPAIHNSNNALNRYAVDKMNGNWGSIEAFLEKGFGFCTLHDDDVLCWCIADCASGDACEIGIRTRPDVRRRGLATLTVAATVDHALSHGFGQVGWHCWEGNAGSIGVAEKVGFELDRRYVAYVRMFDEAYHLAETGLARFMTGQFEEATRCYEQAFALSTDPFPYPYYHMAARAWAAQGNRGMALHYLDLAIAQGEDRLEYTKDCPEFAILHSGTEWQAVLARLEAAIQKT